MVSHVKRGATRLELLPTWGSAKTGDFRHSHTVKRGSSPHGNGCGKNRTSGILWMTFICYAKDDVNNISFFKHWWFSSIKYTTMCTTFHLFENLCQHFVVKNFYFIFKIEYVYAGVECIAFALASSNTLQQFRKQFYLYFNTSVNNNRTRSNSTYFTTTSSWALPSTGIGVGTTSKPMSFSQPPILLWGPSYGVLHRTYYFKLK